MNMLPFKYQSDGIHISNIVSAHRVLNRSHLFINEITQKLFYDKNTQKNLDILKPYIELLFPVFKVPEIFPNKEVYFCKENGDAYFNKIQLEDFINDRKSSRDIFEEEVFSIITAIMYYSIYKDFTNYPELISSIQKKIFVETRDILFCGCEGLSYFIPLGSTESYIDIYHNLIKHLLSPKYIKTGNKAFSFFVLREMFLSRDIIFDLKQRVAGDVYKNALLKILSSRTVDQAQNFIEKLYHYLNHASDYEDVYRENEEEIEWL